MREAAEREAVDGAGAGAGDVPGAVARRAAKRVAAAAGERGDVLEGEREPVAADGARAAVPAPGGAGAAPEGKRARRAAVEGDREDECAAGEVDRESARGDREPGDAVEGPAVGGAVDLDDERAVGDVHGDRGA